jgi:hypothetical protein
MESDMNLNLYQDKGYTSPKLVAQYNLQGRTHYVDDSTLKFHHSRVIDYGVHFGGLMFSIIESCALDMNNTKRGVRFVVFDIAGGVVERASLDDTFKTSAAAKKALRKFIATIDARALTIAALEQANKSLARESDYVRERIESALNENT